MYIFLNNIVLFIKYIFYSLKTVLYIIFMSLKVLLIGVWGYIIHKYFMASVNEISGLIIYKDQVKLIVFIIFIAAMIVLKLFVIMILSGLVIKVYKLISCIGEIFNNPIIDKVELLIEDISYDIFPNKAIRDLHDMGFNNIEEFQEKVKKDNENFKLY